MELDHQTPSLDPGQSPPHRPRAVWRRALQPTRWCVHPAPAVGAQSSALGPQGARDHSGGPALPPGAAGEGLGSTFLNLRILAGCPSLFEKKKASRQTFVSAVKTGFYA